MPDHSRQTGPNTVSPARMYDYMLGGTHNYPVDRAAAEAGFAYDPDVVKIARAARRFLIESVRHISQQGVRNFLDIGSGLPTQENVHEVAQAVNPDAKVVYADNDDSVLPEAEAVIVGDPNTVYIEADVRDPDGILGHPKVKQHLDPDQP
ncbi:SAM-dependent methyltransferase, partial (plasmid) [Actinomadura sp. ATCC 31491]